jgi:diaminopimelate epimerase
MSVITFYKYQGTGNDFVVLGPEIDPDRLSPEQIRHLCDRHFGIGSDGVLCVAKSEQGVAFMRMFNPDGSEAEMCGNGIRCFAKHLSDFGIAHGDVLPIESKVGLHSCRLVKDAAGQVIEVEVGMGRADMRRSAVGMPGEGEFVASALDVGGQTYHGTAVSMGNPHLVVFEKKSIDEAQAVGPQFEHHPWFKNRTNVEFVEVVGEQHLKLVVFERGAGITLACGTGACATVAAAAAEKRVAKDTPVRVDLPGGSLFIRFDPQTDEIFMRGPAVRVFKGEIEI